MSITEDLTTKIAGYRFVQELYRGSRTLVYRGIREKDQQRVVIKLLRKEYPSFYELLQFRNQYIIAKNLQLPGIIIPYSLESYGHSYALIMEDFGGVALTNYTKTHGIKLQEFLKIAIQLAEILHELYRHRVIHKDIKPANILIHPETKQVKLIDFSISSLLPKETQEIKNPQILEGTLAYLSPEQTGRMNRGIDYRSDFYSLGVTLFELLIGYLPFHSDDPMELVHCHIAKNPPTFQEIVEAKHLQKESSQLLIEQKVNAFCDPNLNSKIEAIEEIPEVIFNIIMKLMAKNAEDRYQTALGLKHDLESCFNQWQTLGKIEIFTIGQQDLCDRFIIPEKLYGRETEVQQLLAAFERVSQGHRELMLVAGFSGIGKTAVVNEVHKPIVRQRGYFIKGKFDQFGRNIPFSAFVQAFRDLMGQLLSESDAQLQTWKTKILSAVGENGQVLIEVIPELENIIGTQPAPQALSGSAAQNRFNLLMQKFVQIFTNIEHPLVIFLDDLQWADSASLKLLQLLMQDTGYLLILGAYRDNEVSPTHPFILTVDELMKAGATVNSITLQPLQFTDINQLVADTLNCDLQLAQPLTELVAQKTKGNPFFATQFLKVLHDDQLITFAPPQLSLGQTTGGWQCNITRVKALALTDDVVEFMALQLQKLPPETQEILKLAACIGAQFDLKTLAIISEKLPEITATLLWKALQEGLIIPITEVYKFFTQSESTTTAFGTQEMSEKLDVNATYKFLHDRVQQAAYALIAEDEKKSVHLKIGRLLLNNLQGKAQEEKLFEIVDHLNLGKDLIVAQSQKIELINLNISAGEKAGKATAYTAFKDYLKIAKAYLDESEWESRYDLMFKVHKLLAEAEQLTGNFEESERLIVIALNKAKTGLEKAELYALWIVQYTTLGQGLMAIQTGEKALKILNISLPQATNIEECLHDFFQEVEQTIKENSTEDWLNLPEASLASPRMAIQLLNALLPAAYISQQEKLYFWLGVKIVELSHQYGTVPASSDGFIAYGMFLGSGLGNYQAGYQFGFLGLQISRKYNKLDDVSRSCYTFANNIYSWCKLLKGTGEIFDEGIRAGLESGNFLFIGYTLIYKLLNPFLYGDNLLEILSKLPQYLSFVKKNNHTVGEHSILAIKIIIMSLTGQTSSSLEIEDETEKQYLESCQTHQTIYALCHYYILKSMLLYLYGQSVKAISSSQAAEKMIGVLVSKYQVAIHVFYYSLSLIDVYLKSSSDQQEEYWQKLLVNQQRMRTWAEQCPENFQHKYLLLKAEMARITSKKPAAIELYDRAIFLAKKHQFLNEEALANELAAKFYLEWGKEKVAAGYLQEAYYCYARWGARAKTDDLENRYRHLLQPILQQQQLNLTPLETIVPPTCTSISTSTHSSNTISESLDFASILKAAQVISRSIQLDELMASLTRILLENSGAKKSVLILLKNGVWQVNAITSINDQANSKASIQTVLNCQPLETCQELPKELIQYVKNTQKTLVIDKLQTNIPGVIGNYLLTQQTQSVLCMPILNQSKLIGMVYLENQHLSGVFTNERLNIINLLASQAAISLENAQLYQQMQQALQDLQQTQIQLVQSEKMSALGNLVAGVAHEINNPVSFIAGNINPALEYVKDLLGLIDLYQQIYPHPQAEIEDEIEAIELDYVREDLPKLIESMKLGVERIRNISTSLRTFSRADQDYKVPFNLHEGIDSTLLILKHRLKANEVRPAIEVVTKYGDLPEVKCFPGQLNQVFMNILANAIDAIEESNSGRSFAEIQANPNRLTIQTSVAENQVKITIADNGIGMSEEVKEHIFEHLFTTKAVGKGTGLGLAIAYQIVTEKHGGHIEVESQLGQGSVFVISLPVDNLFGS
jgi:predicted ATPase/signal transduction histidine kinase